MELALTTVAEGLSLARMSCVFTLASKALLPRRLVTLLTAAPAAPAAPAAGVAAAAAGGGAAAAFPPAAMLRLRVTRAVRDPLGGGSLASEPFLREPSKLTPTGPRTTELEGAAAAGAAATVDDDGAQPVLRDKRKGATLLRGPFKPTAFPCGFAATWGPVRTPVGAPAGAPTGAPAGVSTRRLALGVSVVVALRPRAAAASDSRCCSARMEPRFACHVLECCSGCC